MEVVSLDAALDWLDQAIDAVASFEPGGAHLQQVMRARNRMDAIATHCVRQTEKDTPMDRCSPSSFVAWKCRIPTTQARTLVTNGRALEKMPEAVDVAFSSGAITSHHVSALAHAHGMAPTAFDKAQDELLGDAFKLRFGQFYRKVRYFEQLAEPDRVEEEARTVFEERRLHASPTFEDAIVVDAVMDPVGGAIWKRELDRLEKIEFDEDWAEAKQRVGEGVTFSDMRRTPAQRRHDAQVRMAERSAAKPPNAKEARVLLSVLVGYETMYGRICELADGTVITPGQLVPWLDRADVERAVFGPEGRVIDLGRRSRLFVGGTRRAVELSDLECTVEGCDVRFEHCDVDHRVPWAAGGPTDRANGRMRCPKHNAGRRKERPPPDDG